MRRRFLARDYAVAIAGLCGALVFGALVLEHAVEGMEPCALCLMQRLWFLIAGLVAYAGLAHNPRWGIYPLLTFTAALAGGAFAVRQLWLKSLPADQVPACIDLGRLFEFGEVFGCACRDGFRHGRLRRGTPVSGHTRSPLVAGRVHRRRGRSGSAMAGQVKPEHGDRFSVEPA